MLYLEEEDALALAQAQEDEENYYYTVLLPSLENQNELFIYDTEELFFQEFVEE